MMEVYVVISCFSLEWEGGKMNQIWEEVSSIEIGGCQLILVY